jgi:hypothetical protein
MVAMAAMRQPPVASAKSAIAGAPGLKVLLERLLESTASCADLPWRRVASESLQGVRGAGRPPQKAESVEEKLGSSAKTSQPHPSEKSSDSGEMSRRGRMTKLGDAGGRKRPASAV